MKDGFLKHTGNLRHGAIVEWWENPEAARCELPMSRKVPTDFLVMTIAITNHGGFKAESIGNNYGQHVWQILAQGIRLPTCLPMRRTATMNALVLALQSLYLEFEEDERYPSVLQSLLLAACNPNDFGHPPRVPLIEATKRCDQEAIQLLVSHRADVNRTTRGEDYPLIIAIKHHQATIVQCLLECRADPTVRTYYNTQQRTGIAVWSGLSAQQLTYPGTTVARLIEDAAAQWPRVTPSQVD